MVSIRVEMNADGTPRSAVIQDAGQMQANPHFQATADSARRAVLNPRCHRSDYRRISSSIGGS